MRDAADAGHWFAHEGLTKTWTSDIFLLQNNTWSLAGALPEGLAYGASVTLPDAILLIGGEDKSGAARADVTLLALVKGEITLHP